MTSLSLYGADGNPVSAIGREHLGVDGSVELFDGDGYRVPSTEIPDVLYFPFQPEPEEAEYAALALADAALKRAIKAAREVVWAACHDFDGGNRIPKRTDHAIAVLDEALTALETIASVDDGREPHPLELLNNERTDEPLPNGVGSDEMAIIAAGMAMG